MKTDRTMPYSLARCYKADIERYEIERQELLKRIRADTATDAERTRYTALGWKIEAVKQRLDSRYRSASEESVRIMK
jgi:hypothetical protein|nr:hypothetical protein [uncultured Porphyromonas sp.]DAS93047.1 MAG TPA: Protein of unknown function (DUF3135) [Caudoviricetes sp.]DAX38783.1 MAG TPA: Protein of unknown function (DUF3135) [Caudoviricetes sp.]